MKPLSLDGPVLLGVHRDTSLETPFLVLRGLLSVVGERSVHSSGGICVRLPVSVWTSTVVRTGCETQT